VPSHHHMPSPCCHDHVSSHHRVSSPCVITSPCAITMCHHHMLSHHRVSSSGIITSPCAITMLSSHHHMFVTSPCVIIMCHHVTMCNHHVVITSPCWHHITLCHHIDDDGVAVVVVDSQRAFLRFVTGSPRLPPGGLATLSPKFTVVRKHPSNSGGSASPAVSSSPANAESLLAGTTAADNDLPSVMVPSPSSPASYLRSCCSFLVHWLTSRRNLKTPNPKIPK
jgi:hypothetical protein